MNDHTWSRLSHLQIGRYAEYLVKMQFALYPACQTFTAEVDDRGIDFVLRLEPGHHWDVQVKSVRDATYIFMRKSVFAPRDNLLLAAVYFSDGRYPDMFLIPSNQWRSPSAPFVSRDYEGKKSAPEFGIQLSKGDVSPLENFRFDQTVSVLLANR